MRIVSLQQAFCGWLYGQFPPALFGNFKLAGRHLLTQYRSHTAAYKAMKALPGVHHQTHLHPSTESNTQASGAHPIEQYLCH